VRAGAWSREGVVHHYMNKRARNRLIGVTVIILAVAAAVFFGSGASTGAYSKSVDEAVNDPGLVGTRIKVSGSVIAGSWDKKTNPMKFKIRTEGESSGPELSVVYTGAAPNTFGNDTVAIVTGTLEPGGLIKADDMITKCPSKYSSGTGAVTVAELLKLEAKAQPIQVVGYLKAGSLNLEGQGNERFVLTSTASGSGEIRVQFAGAMPEGTKDGVQLVVGGEYDSTGVVSATSVARLAGK
jgi:cytochrome c-type biogenesis protein CcmE